MNVNIPAPLLNALNVIAPTADDLFKDEHIESSCCSSLCFSTKLGPQVTKAIKDETKILSEMVADITKNITENSSYGRITVNNAMLTRMISKYEESKNCSLDTIKHHQDMDKANRCIGSIFCSSPDVKAAQVRNSHITSHLGQLLSLQEDAKDTQKKFKEATDKLDERSLKTPKKQDIALGDISLSLLKKSTDSLNAETLKFESKEVKNKEQLFAKINKFFGINEEKTLSFVEETRTHHALKFCSQEAYVYMVSTMNDCLVQKCQGKMISEVDDKNKFKEISIEKRKSGALAVTSLALVVISSDSENRKICTVEATLEAIIHSKDSVELSCTFDNIELLPTALLKDTKELEKVFS